MLVGDVLADRYELEELAGSGGMSTVFRAHDRVLERTVALKILHQRYNDEDEYVERFRREARMAAGLSHHNIVTVIDRGEHEGRQFIVFEYVDGDNLKELVDRDGAAAGRARARRSGSRSRPALAFAHANGLVHRDVKPQNVLLNGDGTAKVTDFGIARSLDVGKGVTQTGTVLGTSDYIAPEQAQGQPVGERTDVYSLGVVLYELLTGELPFTGDNFVAIAMKHINEPAPRVSDAAAGRAAAARRRDRDRAREGARRRASRAWTTSAASSRRASRRCAPASRSRLGADGTVTVVLPPRRSSRSVAARWRSGPVAADRARARAARRPPCGSASTTLGRGRRLRRAAAHRRRRSSRSSCRASASWDPRPGDGDGEHDAEAPLATDGNQATYWPTENYTTARFGKPGVGLVLDAGEHGQPRRG